MPQSFANIVDPVTGKCNLKSVTDLEEAKLILKDCFDMIYFLAKADRPELNRVTDLLLVENPPRTLVSGKAEGALIRARRR